MQCLNSYLSFTTWERTLTFDTNCKCTDRSLFKFISFILSISDWWLIDLKHTLQLLHKSAKITSLSSLLYFCSSALCSLNREEWKVVRTVNSRERTIISSNLYFICLYVIRFSSWMGITTCKYSIYVFWRMICLYSECLSTSIIWF